MTTASPVYCAHCLRPVVGAVIYHGGYSYHYECTRPPGSQTVFQPVQPSPFDESAVRRIVREELVRMGVVVVGDR